MLIRLLQAAETPWRRLLVYTWAAPNTLLGLTAGALVLAAGGRLRLVHGAAEFSGGRLGRLARRQRFCALTLGHVILGTSERSLALARDHEHVHVRQYERWGPLFLPAYATSSVWQVLRGRRAYLDNVFERQAYAQPSPRPSPRGRG